MILRLSQELATKLMVAPKVCVPLDRNPFAEEKTLDRTTSPIANFIPSRSPALPARGVTVGR